MKSTGNIFRRFDLSGRIAVITGGSGLLGREHAIALAECGAVPVLLDIDRARLTHAVADVREATGVKPRGLVCDITVEGDIRRAEKEIGAPVSILVNNAANNPKVEGAADFFFLFR